MGFHSTRIMEILKGATSEQHRGFVAEMSEEMAQAVVSV